MNGLFFNLKSKILTRRALALFLIPFIIFGLYYIYLQQNSPGVETYALDLNPDPLAVTYTPEGADPPGPDGPPMFVVTNMLPGDEKEKDFNVKNGAPQDEEVTMDFVKTDEDKEFADILDVEVRQLPSTIIFSGKLEDLFSEPPINLGVFSEGEDKTYRVKVYFPHESGNEYQNALVVFDIIWQTELPPIEIPEECSELAGKIVNVIEGTEGDDRIHGTHKSDLILAKGGNDRIDASSDSDCIVAGNGNDRIDSESGDDIILAGPGNDRVHSGSGNDKVWGGAGNDRIDLGSGNDLAYGSGGDDRIDGGDGEDEIYGGPGNDEIRGGSMDDMLFGEEGDDEITGSSGNDLLDGGLDFDDLTGNSGTDTCLNGEDNFSCEL